MGKYMRKAKVSGGEVAVMELPAAPLGVRTRARALALQRQEKLLPQGEEAAEKGEYLELRSRRLEKLPPPPAAAARRRATAAAAAALAAAESAEAEVSFGENFLELEAMERSTRETTPCSLIRDSETISTPGSTTRPSHSNSYRKVQSAVRRNIIPASAELEAFFAAEEQRQRQAFIDKFNFDPANDCPLPGRYDWVKLD